MQSILLNLWQSQSLGAYLMKFLSSNSHCSLSRQELLNSGSELLALTYRCCRILSSLKVLRLILMHNRSSGVCYRGDHIDRLPLDSSSLRKLRNGSSHGSWVGFFLLWYRRFGESYHHLRLTSPTWQLGNHQTAFQHQMRFGLRNKK